MRIQIGRWFIGIRIGKFSTFTTWVNDTSAKNYTKQVLEALEPREVK